MLQWLPVNVCKFAQNFKLKIMKKNVGSIDKVIRFIVALVAIWAGYSLVPNPWNYVLYGVAAIMVITAFTSTCPIWLATGINTIKSTKKSD